VLLRSSTASFTSSNSARQQEMGERFMRILKVCLTVVALAAAPIASASAEEAGGAKAPSVASELPRDQGWNSGSWALLFDLNNIFQNQQTLNQFAQLGVGAEYFVNSQMALRVGASYGYKTDPAQVTKTTNNETGGTPAVTTYSVTTPAPVDAVLGESPTSVSTFNARVDFLYRFMLGSVAPYAGAGVFFDWRNASRDYVDDVSVVNQTTTVHDYGRGLGGGLRGLLGAEWRLHPNFSLFAEYSLDVTLASQNSLVKNTTVEVTAGGERTVNRNKTEQQTPASFGTRTALTHAGQLGLAVHF
jgi:hypothetical protein